MKKMLLLFALAVGLEAQPQLVPWAGEYVSGTTKLLLELQDPAEVVAIPGLPTESSVSFLRSIWFALQSSNATTSAFHVTLVYQVNGVMFVNEQTITATPGKFTPYGSVRVPDGVLTVPVISVTEIPAPISFTLPN